MAESYKKGKVAITVGNRSEGYKKKEVSGWLAPSGLAIHKGEGRTGYTISQTHSGIAVANANSFEEAKAKAERLGKVTNWHKEVKPSYTLAQKVRAADSGEKYKRPYKKLRDAYDIKAHAKRGGHIVDHEQTRGYEAQQRERGKIRRFLHTKHIGYTIDVRNTTKGKKIT